MLSEIMLQCGGNSLIKIMGIFQQIPVITHLSQNFNKLLGVTLQTTIKKSLPPFLLLLVIQQQLTSKCLLVTGLWFPQ